MIKVSVTINRNQDTVWEYFTKASNWTKWYGGELKEVVPGWQKGGRLIWAMGVPSTIGEFSPKKTIFLPGTWMDTTYNFKASGDSQTIVEIVESDPKGGASFSDGGAKQRLQLLECLNKLKSCIESETSKAKGASAAEVKNKAWWQFWK